MVIISALILFSFIPSISTVFKGFKNVYQNNYSSSSNSTLLTVKFAHKTASGKTVKEKFSVSEDVFFEDTTIYNNDLSLFLFALSVSAFSSGDISAHWGEDGDFGREKAIKKAFDDISLKKQKFIGYEKSLNNSSSKAAFAIGTRKIFHKDERNNLVVVVVRGGGYGAEWSDNFSLGSQGKYHKGFENSADIIKAYTDTYIAENCDTDDVKILVTGYSRGGGVANILCNKLNETKNNNTTVIGYTFATPNTTIQNNYDLKLFNIINPYDAIPMIPPKKWNFRRCGKDIVFPLKNQDNSILDIYNEVSSQYYNLTGEQYDMVSENSMKVIIDIMLNLSEDRGEFSKKYEPIFKDIMLFYSTKVKKEKWERVGFIKFIIDKYGTKAKNAIQKVKNSTHMISAQEVGVSLPEELVNFMILTEIHGISSQDDIVISNFNIETLKNLYKTFSKGSFSVDTKPHSFETYLAWLKTYDIWEYLS